MAKIGFYGGAFNPPTKAHIELAKKVINECKLDKIIFVPVNDLYKKEGLIESEHRVNMLKLVCKEDDNLEVSDIELKSNVNYKAIDIFRIIDKEYNKDEKFYIMGTDNLKKICKWKESERLVEDFNYIILNREDDDAKKIIEENKLLEKNKNKFNIIKNNNFKKCSSTNIRNQIKNKEIPVYIDENVYDYILKNNIKF